MNSTLQQLIEAEKKAIFLFNEIEKRQLIVSGKSEKQLNSEIFDLAHNLFDIKKYWHKRIVRAGKNTLHPYSENPKDLIINSDDILFIDFGPIFDEWEADFGRTYVIGKDPLKQKLKRDIAEAWANCKTYYRSKREITGAQLYKYACDTAIQCGWTFGGEIAGHIIGQFPHEKLENENKTHYVHPENHLNMKSTDDLGSQRNWILEIHFVDREKEIGGFYEQLLI